MEPNNSIPTADAAGSLLDLEAIKNLRALREDGQPDPFAEFVDLFLADTPQRIAQIRIGLEKCSAHDVEAAAHSLKGSASNLGARTLTAACARMMQHARQNDLAPVRALLQTVEYDFQRVHTALVEELKK